MEYNYRARFPPPCSRYPAAVPYPDQSYPYRSRYVAAAPYPDQAHRTRYPAVYSYPSPRSYFDYNYPPEAPYQNNVSHFSNDFHHPRPPGVENSNASVTQPYNDYYNSINSQYSNPDINTQNYISHSHTIITNQPKEYNEFSDYSKALNDYKKDSDEYKKFLDKKYNKYENEYNFNLNKNKSSLSARDRNNCNYYNRSRSRSKPRSSSSKYRRTRSRSQNRRRSRSRSMNSRRTKRDENAKNSRDSIIKSREDYMKKRQNSTKLRVKLPTERETLLAKWRKNYCATSEEMTSKLEELSKFTQEETIEHEKSIWTRTTPADLYYIRDEENPKIIRGTAKLAEISNKFNDDLVTRVEKINALKPKYELPERKKKTRLCKHKSEQCSDDDSDNSSENFSDVEENIMEELTRKQQHPDRLHPEMWYNDPGEMNDGPLCRCSLKSRKSGIRHGIYAGERFLKVCDKNTNNSDKLFHYRITISPPTNFLTKTPTIIKHDEHEFIFEGFSMFSHFPLLELPTCKVIRFNIEYTILYIEEKHPDNFTIRELDLFHDYLFKELLELVDLDFKAAGDTNGCSQFHFMPRFVRDLPDNGREILSMKEVLQYLLNSSKLLLQETDLSSMVKMSQYEWQALADEVKGMVVTYPGKKPCSVRVDQLDRNSDLQIPEKPRFPDIVHFGIRPPQLSYAGNPEYQKAWRDYVKFRHLLANMSKPTFEDKRKLEAKEIKLQEMRTQSKMKRDVTVAVSAEGFCRTGIMCDIIQHAMLIPVLVCHLRFHHSLNVLEENIGYKFKNRALLQLALTHPSYRENFGTNPDHARNSLTNCGIRQPEYGDRRIHYMNTRKRGINTLINIMSRFGKKYETESNITHNERLEFLGDAVVEFLSSIHLFRMFPDLEEGGLATYRAAIVQNQHLAVLARTLCLDQFMLYAHGSDLCHDLELRHAMANCFEALMGALFLDGGIEIADKVFGTTLFKNDPQLLEVWENLPPHPLQEQEPTGDRQWIPNFELLRKLTKFEESIGVDFKHIRLLARAFTDRSIGYTNLTLGSNQRLEFLGDTVLQLIASEYLYKFFPEHHEGHLSLLRSSLVNNRTQAVVCDDLGMSSYAVYNNPKAELKTKDRADLLEAFVGALYIDQGLEYCRVFCQVTLFPRLQDFIMNQDWNDPKSKLQQCCLTLRTMDGGEPDIPVYKVIECKGPTNTRVYTVAVYFRGRRLAKATGHSIQQAEMNSAKKALEISHDLFPQLDHQKRVIAKSMKKQKYPHKSRKNSVSSSDDESQSSSQSKKRRSNSIDSNPKQYRDRCTSTSKRRSRRSRSRSRSTGRVLSKSKDVIYKTKHNSTLESTRKSTSQERQQSIRRSRSKSRSPKRQKSHPKDFIDRKNSHRRFELGRRKSRSTSQKRSSSTATIYKKRSRSRSPFEKNSSRNKKFKENDRISVLSDKSPILHSKSRSRSSENMNSHLKGSKSKGTLRCSRSKTRSPFVPLKSRHNSFSSSSLSDNDLDVKIAKYDSPNSTSTVGLSKSNSNSEHSLKMENLESLYSTSVNFTEINSIDCEQSLKKEKFDSSFSTNLKKNSFPSNSGEPKINMKNESFDSPNSNTVLDFSQDLNS